ncbi:RL34 [Hepatospora eriocheir]|uniref:RL34 n=1 Tax=Hepatospora eriocheir TaxID=1081669 RepID=A0A1X0QJW0_9MICR|nr:RL34 [Hepatospora eriocheir]ORE00071.1 RL34 [Hepatospora eriocheir]
MRPVIKHRGNTYKTKSNRREVRRGPSGKLTAIKVGKKGNVHHCHECERPLYSIAALRTAEFSRQKVSARRVSRILGATICGKCVEKKVITTFLEQESKAVSIKK